MEEEVDVRAEGCDSELSDGEHRLVEGEQLAIVFDPELNPSEVIYGVRKGRAITDGDIDLGAVEDVQRRTEFARLFALVSKLPSATDVEDAAQAGLRPALDGLKNLVHKDFELLVVEHIRSLRPGRLPATLAEAAYKALASLAPDQGATTPISILGAAIQGRRWPGGVVPYENVSAPDKQVRDALAYWEGRTPVQLRPRRESDPNYVRIVRSGDCSSAVGMSGRAQTIEIDPDCGAGGLAHEFGHAIGLHHEQTRPDRTPHVRINWSNIRSGAAKNFRIRPRALTYGTPYDWGSIMHYGLYAFAKNRRVRTIIPLQEPDTNPGQRRRLSEHDIATVTAMYSGEL